MNILPKKSWHVRNKDNIERVRRDEEKAAEEEKEREKRIAIAESEARTELLRKKSRQHQHETSDELDLPATSAPQHRHINFFEDLEHGKLGGKNAEYEEEKRLEKEKQEKAIGLLTYLGQGSVELEANKPWYFKPPEKRKSNDDRLRDEVDAKKKHASDPMSKMNRYVDQSIKVRKLKHGGSADEGSHHSHHHRHKKETDSKPRKSKTIEELRAERMHREQQERHRAEQLIAKMHGGAAAEATQETVVDDRQRRYNSQFNPDIARRPRTHDSY